MSETILGMSCCVTINKYIKALDITHKWKNLWGSEMNKLDETATKKGSNL